MLNGNVLTFGRRGIHVWDREAYRRTNQPRTVSGDGGTWAVGRKGKYAAVWKPGAEGGVVAVCDSWTGKVEASQAVPGGNPGWVPVMCASPTERVFAFSSPPGGDGSPRAVVLDTAGGKTHVLAGRKGNGTITRLAFDQLGTVLAAETTAPEGPPQVTVWEVGSGTCVRTIPGRLASGPDAMSFSTERPHLFVRVDTGVVVVSVGSGEVKAAYSEALAGCRLVCLSPDGTTVAAADDSGAIRIIRLRPEESGGPGDTILLTVPPAIRPPAETSNLSKWAVGAGDYSFEGTRLGSSLDDFKRRHPDAKKNSGDDPAGVVIYQRRSEAEGAHATYCFFGGRLYHLSVSYEAPTGGMDAVVKRVTDTFGPPHSAAGVSPMAWVFPAVARKAELWVHGNGVSLDVTDTKLFGEMRANEK